MAYHFNDNVYTKSFTPREYQVELLDAAKERNIIVCLGTGSSKIFIATKLIQELANAVRRPFRHGGKRTLYLVDTVAMVAQQASYIRHLTDLSVGEYTSGDTVDTFDMEDWEQQFQENQVLVMTSHICLEILKCGFMQLNCLNLIVLDECHRALREHPMRQIMKEFVYCFEQPRILGLTAPLLNSICDPGRLEGELRRLELVLHSAAETASDIVSVLRYCTKPKELVVECSLPTPGPLDKLLENLIRCTLAFLTDHRYDPSEVYEDEFEEELKGIPDPKIDPQKILNDFLDVLHTLGFRRDMFDVPVLQRCDAVSLDTRFLAFLDGYIASKH